MSRTHTQFTAIVLAGDRGPDDAVAQAAGVSCKALVPVAGKAMLLRVLAALAAAETVGSCLVCGSSSRLLQQCPELAERVADGRIRWLENADSPSRSALAALQALTDDAPILLTTADHALLTPAMVDYFCGQALATDCDVVAGLARAELVQQAFPESRRTVTRLRGDNYCGCNLFAFLTPRAASAVEFWKRVEAQRKNPLKIIKALGPITVLRYLFGRLTLAQGLARLSTLTGARAGVVWMPEAETAVDVDKIEDWQLAEKILRKREQLP
jgi:GTP:adenosylcobinamide-phosphate guanylyltransferase